MIIKLGRKWGPSTPDLNLERMKVSSLKLPNVFGYEVEPE